jgi:2-dehydro-3-deoxyphosphogalactonate aldolase
MSPFSQWLNRLPLVAILRGIRPAEVLEIGEVLVEAGFCLIEVPLNSPEPYASIVRLAKRFGDRILTGAGTVTDPAQVEQVAEAGGRLIVMPHADERVVETAKRRGMYALPGFATATEAFRMIAAGADALKLFPAEANPPKVLKALRAVLPPEMPVLPVGGITPQNLREYREAGAAGFGLGSALYKAGAKAEEVSRAANAFRQAYETLPKSRE